jgi:hypothetical protein
MTLSGKYKANKTKGSQYKRINTTETYQLHTNKRVETTMNSNIRESIPTLRTQLNQLWHDLLDTIQLQWYAFGNDDGD